jgi:hypothetical protein
MEEFPYFLLGLVIDARSVAAADWRSNRSREKVWAGERSAWKAGPRSASALRVSVGMLFPFASFADGNAKRNVRQNCCRFRYSSFHWLM